MNAKILIVDDEKTIVFALEESLLDEGYDVRTAHSGEQGLELFKKEVADVVLTDLKMPGMTGMELLSKVKEISPSTHVVIITAYGNFDSAVEAVRLGAFDYIQKPFQINNVKQVVAKALNERKALPEKVLCEKQDSPKPEQNLLGKPLDIREKILPSGESVLGSLSVDVKTVPMTGLGADFYDYFYVNDDSILVAIGDVGEKGVDGSMVMIMVKSLIRSEAGHCGDPVEIVNRVNTHIRNQGIQGIPVSLFLGILDIRQGLFRYVNAGHEKPLFFHHGDVFNPNMLGENGAFIGLFKDLNLRLSTVAISQGDVFLMFTDGFIRIIEEKHPKQNPYEILKQRAQNSLPEKRYFLAENLYRHFKDDTCSQKDDVTVMSLCYGPVLAQEKEIRCSSTGDSIVMIRLAADDFLRAQNLSYSQRHAIMTALIEALINVISFAYADGDPGEMVVKFKIDNDRLIIEVQDFGRGFDLASYEQPDNISYEGLIKESGRGIFLMKRLVDNVIIDTAPGKGFKVVLEKTIEQNTALKTC